MVVNDGKRSEERVGIAHEWVQSGQPTGRGALDDHAINARFAEEMAVVQAMVPRGAVEEELRELQELRDAEGLIEEYEEDEARLRKERFLARMEVVRKMTTKEAIAEEQAMIQQLRDSEGTIEDVVKRLGLDG